MNLLDQKCFNHAQREAVARCPGCGHFFCRECIAEHQDRVLCAACLRQQPRLSASRRSGLALAWRLSLFLGGVVITWIFFYLVGRVLVSLPDSFHEGTLWRRG